MTREVMLVFQDCYDCEPHKKWYDSQVAKAGELGIIIRPMPHTALGAKGLILKANRRGAQRLPFLTDGKNKFAYSISRFAEVNTPKAKQAKRGVKNESIKETD